MKRYFFKNRITANYLFVLLIILVIPLIVSTILLQYTVRFAVSQSEESRFMQLEQTRDLVDRNLLFLRRTAIRVAQNRALLELDSYNPKSTQDVYNTFLLAEELAQEVDTNDFCLGYYVYSRSANLIFYGGSRYQAQDFFNTYVRSGQYETWKRRLENDYFDFCNADVGELNKLSENGTVEYRQSYPLGGVSRGTIVFLFDKGIFIPENMKKQSGTNEVQLYVYNKNNENICRTYDEEESVLQQYLKMPDGYSYGKGWNKRLICRTTSDTGSLRYIWIDNGSQAFRSVRAISLFSALYSIVVLLGGGLYIYSNTRMMSKKSRKIYELLGEKDSAGSVLDWNVLLDSLEDLSQKSNSLDLLVSVKNDMTKNKLFINLLYDRSGYEEQYKNQLEELGVHFDAPDYMLLLGTFKISVEEKPELIKYAIQNILSDLMGSTIQWYFIDYNWNQIMFLLKGSVGEHFREEAENICAMAAEFIQSILDIELEFDAGEICHSIEGVRATARELLERYEYRSTYDIDAAADSLEQTKYGYLQKQENEMMSLVLSGSRSEMEEFLNRLIAEHKHTKPVILRTLFSNLLGTLFKCAERAGVSNMLEEAEINSILYSQNFSEVEETLKKSFVRVCEGAAHTEDTGHLSALSLKLMNYVDSNFQEPGLSLKTLSAEFGITVSYASKIFKERLGNNFSDYLTAKRIESAKQLLEESKLSVSEIAQRTGYIDSSIFIKNFKKVMKMTPGAYRDTLR